MIDHSFVFNKRYKLIKFQIGEHKKMLEKVQREYESNIHFETGQRFELIESNDKIKELQEIIILKERELSRLQYEIAN